MREIEMALTVEDYINAFPHPLIIKIQGLPTYEAIAEVQRLLNANAASIECTLGGGALGYLALTVSPAVYATHSNVPFVAPVNPGYIPVIPANATAAQTTEAVRQHNELKRVWLEFQGVSKALRQQALGAVDEIYVRSLRHRITGYANCTVWEILNHLLTNYGRVTPYDLLLNDLRMRTPYNTEHTIEVLIAQIEDAIDYASAGGQAYSPAQIVNLAYSLIFATGQFDVACREWRGKVANDKTWANFKTHFTAAYNDLREATVATLGGGFHGANSATGDYLTSTAEAFANLATATQADREAAACLITSNSTLTQQLAARDAKIRDLENTIKNLKNNTASNNGGSTSNTERRTGPRPIRITPNNNYCWTHGYQIANDHTSASCTKPREGHQHDATVNNPKGGSTFGKTT
jgi:hypothetical protein